MSGAKENVGERIAREFDGRMQSEPAESAEPAFTWLAAAINEAIDEAVADVHEVTRPATISGDAWSAVVTETVELRQRAERAVDALDVEQGRRETEQRLREQAERDLNEARTRAASISNALLLMTENCEAAEARLARLEKAANALRPIYSGQSERGIAAVPTEQDRERFEQFVRDLSGDQPADREAFATSRFRQDVMNLIRIIRMDIDAACAAVLRGALAPGAEPVDPRPCPKHSGGDPDAVCTCPAEPRTMQWPERSTPSARATGGGADG